MRGNITIAIIMLLGFVFGGSFSALAYSVDSSGGELVPNVLQFRAVPGDKHVVLSWENPMHADFSGVSIVRSDQNYIPAYDANLSVYKGSDKSFIDLNLANDKTYFYTIFAYNSKGAYSSGSIAKAIPKLPSLTQPYQQASSDYLDTSQAAPPGPTKKIDKIELADFYYYLVLNKKVLQIGLSDSGELHVVGGSTVLIEIPSDIFLKPLNVISVSTDESSYLMTLIPDKNKYQLVISTPKNQSNSQLRFVAVFKDKTISDASTKLLIDPEGYVYQSGSSFLGFGKKQEMRVPGAKVVIYQKDGAGWKVWDAQKYFQQNSQITGSSGEYAFFVPKGEYYLEVSKTGFKRYKSDPFSVTGPKILNKNIEITPWLDLRVLVGIILLVILIFLLIFHWRKKSSNLSH